MVYRFTLEFQWNSTKSTKLPRAEKALCPTSKSGRMDCANAMCEVVRRPLKSTSLTLPGCLAELTGKEDVIVVTYVANLIGTKSHLQIQMCHIKVTVISAQ